MAKLEDDFREELEELLAKATTEGKLDLALAIRNRIEEIGTPTPKGEDASRASATTWCRAFQLLERYSAAVSIYA